MENVRTIDEKPKKHKKVMQRQDGLCKITMTVNVPEEKIIFCCKCKNKTKKIYSFKLDKWLRKFKCKKCGCENFEWIDNF